MGKKTSVWQSVSTWPQESDSAEPDFADLYHPPRTSADRPTWHDKLVAALPQQWQKSMVRLTTAHLVAITVLLGLAFGGALWAVYGGSPEPTAIPVRKETQQPLSAPPQPRSTSPTPKPPATVVVYVSGAVATPGVVTLPADARIHAAVQQSGGPKKSADLTHLNLAQVVTDGQHIHVPIPGESPRPQPLTARSSHGSSPSHKALINLNSASAAELEQLPGVGPVLAERIVEYRTQHGGFAHVDELSNVPGLGAKSVAQLANHATL